MTPNEVRAELAQLKPEIPWAHAIQLADDVTTVDESNPQFYKKAVGLKVIGDLFLSIARSQVRGHSLSGKTVLDLACGEGGHSLQFAAQGARVTGLEGRSLYVNRARFAARAMGANVEFIQGDVRKVPNELGPFDVVLFSGIWHHLGVDDFDAIPPMLARLTSDLLLIYTHVSTPMSVQAHRLKGPVTTPKGSTGWLFREHADDASAAAREAQVRASLDNTFSFWAQEQDIVNALKSAGFPLIMKVLLPHPFGWDNASYRPVIAAKKSFG